MLDRKEKMSDPVMTWIGIALLAAGLVRIYQGIRSLVRRKKNQQKP